MTEFFALMAAERKDVVDRLQNDLYKSIDHYHHVALLCVAVAGVALPILISQATNVAANTWFLRRAVLAFSLCIGIATILAGAYRWAAGLIAADVWRLFGKENEAIGRSDGTPGGMATAVKQAREEILPSLQTRFSYWKWAGAAGDVLIYGVFLWGVYDVVRAL
jgi:hypothetical protein